MENASKSLIMVGGVIIGTMVISIMVYLFSVFGTFSGEMSSKANSEKNLQFNNNYFQYQGRIDITAQEIVSCINYTKEHNEYTGIKDTEEGFVQVYVDGVQYLNSSGVTKDLNEFLNSANNPSSPKTIFKCGAVISEVHSQVINYSGSPDEVLNWYKIITKKENLTNAMLNSEEGKKLKEETQKKYKYYIRYNLIGIDPKISDPNLRNVENHIHVNTEATGLVDKIYFFSADFTKTDGLKYSLSTKENCVFDEK